MEKPGTISLIGEDKALEISRAIIRTHEQVLQNVAILTDRERGYMFNEYFPAVKDYLIIEPDILVPYMEPVKPIRKTITEAFFFARDAGQPLTMTLSNLPKVLVSVRVSKNKEAEARGYSWWLEPLKSWTVNKTTGVIDFMEDINTIEIMDFLEVNSDFYIFVDYIGAQVPAYEVGADGELN